MWQNGLIISGNIKVFCRTRPLFEDEGPSVVEFPDNFTIRVNTGDDTISNPKKDFEFDRVYGPHVGQGECEILWMDEWRGGYVYSFRHW